MQTLIAIWVSFVMLFVNFIPGFVLPEDTKNKVDKSYPYVFVHGFLGWGGDEGINSDLSYWGATSCDLVSELTDKGVDCHSASVGPFSSNWDRACELYAQLTGTRVDYGEAHSKAHSHLRYGRTYEEPLIEGWGEKDENGLVNKVNLIGHSFGGNTSRLLAGLLSQGSAEEMAVTPADDISPLFTGGKSNWVNSLITVCTPHNGTSFAYVFDALHLRKILETIVFAYAGILGRSHINGYVDFHLEQFGLTSVPNGEMTAEDFGEAMMLILSQENDNAAYDLTPDWAEELNSDYSLTDDVYYFSYPFSTTVELKLTGTHYPLPSTLAVLRLPSILMGLISKNIITDYEIDSSWLENDGLVSVVSAQYPIGSEHQDYDPDNIAAGIWNVMPLSTGDHGNAIGIGTSEEQTVDFYMSMIDMVERLPVES